MSRGKIIILNGASSTGKTTLAKALQNVLAPTYVRLSIDDFVKMLPEKKMIRERQKMAWQAEMMLLRTIKMLSESGVNVIVDNVITNEMPVFEQYLSLLHDDPVLLVRVDCPLPELRRRELARGDRRPGISEAQLSALVPEDGYDVVVNTFEHTATACADAIAQRLALADGISAIKQMWQRAALSGTAEGSERILCQEEEY